MYNRLFPFFGNPEISKRAAHVDADLQGHQA
jgi:hypothetical protein